MGTHCQDFCFTGCTCVEALVITPMPTPAPTPEPKCKSNGVKKNKRNNKWCNERCMAGATCRKRCDKFCTPGCKCVGCSAKDPDADAGWCVTHCNSGTCNHNDECS